MDIFNGPYSGLYLLAAFCCGVVVGSLMRSSGSALRDGRLDEARRHNVPNRFEDIDPKRQQEIRNATAAGKKIEAIMMVRQQTNLGLREAKELVDRLSG